EPELPTPPPARPETKVTVTESQEGQSAAAEQELIRFMKLSGIERDEMDDEKFQTFLRMAGNLGIDEWRADEIIHEFFAEDELTPPKPAPRVAPAPAATAVKTAPPQRAVPDA